MMICRIALRILFFSLCCCTTQAWSFPAAANHLSTKCVSLVHRTKIVVCMASGREHGRDKSTKQNQQEMINFMDKPMESTVGDLPSSPVQQEDSELVDFVKCIVRAADGRKAEDIVALRVDRVSTLASALVVLSGNSRPQNQAIASAILKDVEEQYGMKPGGNGVPEGSAQSGWILLDYGNVIAHIMTPKSRLFYNVEGQWRDKGGVYMDISDVLVPNKIEGSGDSEAFVDDAEDDPFWS